MSLVLKCVWWLTVCCFPFLLLFLQALVTGSAGASDEKDQDNKTNLKEKMDTVD